MNVNVGYLVVVTLISIYLIRKGVMRLQLSRAKHASLRGHSKWSRRIAKLVPFFDYSASEYFRTDGAPNQVAEQRAAGMQQLLKKLTKQNSNTLNCGQTLESSISDVKFTSFYRIPFPYRTHLPAAFKFGSIVEQSDGVRLKDIDGNWRYDLSGSYGVNVFGYDFYKTCMDKGFAKVNTLGPVLGPYHPLIAENVEQIKSISGLDEVSFHMSGTEAVMQAVRLARYHTGKSHLVRFCGAYHGWWDGVQPGVGNQRQVNDVYTLADLSEHALKVLSTRNDIACVLINPLQAFHPNADSATDATLIASERATKFDKKQYSAWLKKIRHICSKRNIVLIFDEVFTGFRLSYRGAQGYFGVQADMVTYGKTLGGGLPVGVLAGRHKFMKRFSENSPANLSFARGTFNSHPYVMAAMHEFLIQLKTPAIQTLYQSIEALWNSRVEQFNQRLATEQLPLKITNMHTILSVIYTQPCRYNWMLQFYLRAAGIELSWIGTGRLIMSFNFSDQDFAEVVECFVKAAKQMQQDGWWWKSANLTNKAIKRQFLRDLLVAKFPVLAMCYPSPLPFSDDTEQANELPQTPKAIEKVG